MSSYPSGTIKLTMAKAPHHGTTVLAPDGRPVFTVVHNSGGFCSGPVVDVFAGTPSGSFGASPALATFKGGKVILPDAGKVKVSSCSSH
jgi:hypothetical protein